MSVLLGEIYRLLLNRNKKKYDSISKNFHIPSFVIKKSSSYFDMEIKKRGYIPTPPPPSTKNKEILKSLIGIFFAIIAFILIFYIAYVIFSAVNKRKKKKRNTVGLDNSSTNTNSNINTVTNLYTNPNTNTNSNTNISGIINTATNTNTNTNSNNSKIMDNESINTNHIKNGSINLYPPSINSSITPVTPMVQSYQPYNHYQPYYFPPTPSNRQFTISNPSHAPYNNFFPDQKFYHHSNLVVPSRYNHPHQSKDYLRSIHSAPYNNINNYQNYPPIFLPLSVDNPSSSFVNIQETNNPDNFNISRNISFASTISNNINNNSNVMDINTNNKNKGNNTDIINNNGKNNAIDISSMPNRINS